MQRGEKQVLEIKRYIPSLLVYPNTMEYYSAVRKNENLPFATWMGLEGIMFSEISQKKDNYYTYFICKI